MWWVGFLHAARKRSDQGGLSDVSACMVLLQGVPVLPTKHGPTVTLLEKCVRISLYVTDNVIAKLYVT